MRWKALGSKTLTRGKTNRNRRYTRNRKEANWKVTCSPHVAVKVTVRLSHCLRLGAIREVLRPFRH